MPKVTEQHRLARQAEIVAAALAAFRRKGFQATSLAEIIAESGLSAGAIYGYFPAKIDIVHAVASAVVSARLEDLDVLAQQDPMPEPAVMIRNILVGAIDSVGVPGILLQVWGEAVTDEKLREMCLGIFAALREGIADYLARWQQTANGLSEVEAQQVAAELAPLFLSVINGFVVQDSLVADFDRESFLANVLAYLPK